MVTQRNYVGDSDLDATLGLWLAVRSTAANDPWPPLDTINAELVALPAGSPLVRLWEDRGSRLIGVALLLDASILVWGIRPGADSELLEAEMLGWALQEVLRSARSAGEQPALFVPVPTEDLRLAELLSRSGFREDEWHTLRMARSLSGPIATPQLPTGIAIRPVADHGELDAVIALHSKIFLGGTKTRGERDILMRAPGYSREFDLVAANSDGAVVGYALGMRCDVEARRLGQAQAWVEFVGVDHGHRGQGLGRALTLTLLRAMHMQGLTTALLSTGATNRAARRLFEDCGFNTRRIIRWFVGDSVGGQS